MTTIDYPATPVPGDDASLAAVASPELYLPLPKTFDSVEEERLHRKTVLAAGLRMLSRAGCDEGVAGHVTVRDPEFPDTFWVNPFGFPFSLMKQSDLVRVSHEGKVVEGSRAVNGAAVAIHCMVHEARPDSMAAAHAHGPYGKTLSALDCAIEPLTQDSCSFFSHHSRYAEYHGVVQDFEEGRRIAAALGQNKAVILQNHGMLTVGETIESALWWFLTLERTCQSQLMAYSAAAGLGRPPILIDAVEAEATRGQVGFELAGWFQFQPILERMLHEHPEVAQ